MKIRLLISTLFAACTVTAALQAAPLTPEQALQRLGRSHAKSGVALPANLAPTYTAQRNGTWTWYAFNAPQGGYAIVAADDAAQPLLGYVPEGSFSIGNLPPALKWWLDNYSDEIAQAAAKGIPATDTKRSDARKPIAPMTATRWDQGSPYNDLCPVRDDKKTFTGCVATAFAQVMNYHKFPQKGTGSVSYIWNGGTMSMDFSTVTFDWQNMTDAYTASSTEAQKNAVATLMKACGYAVNSNYGTVATDASVYLWAPSLINYFGYAPSLQPVNRIYYTLKDWEDLIYNSLDDGAPVLYSGIGSAGGHAFVCDGYSNGGYFHFNWGWSGLSDGYFLLSALNPSALGIGGGAGGFNSGQIAVVNIKPNYSGAVMTPAMGMLQGATLSYSNISKNFTLTGGFMNLSNVPIEAKVGFEIVGDDGNPHYAGTTNSYAEYPMQTVSQSYARRLQETLPDGSYKVYPAFATKEGDSDQWHRMMVPAANRPYWTLTMANGKGTLEAQKQNTEVTVTGLHALTTAHPRCDFKVEAMIANHRETEFMYDVYVVFTDKNGKELLRSDANPVDIMSGDSVRFEALVSPGDKLKPGTVDMALQVVNEQNSGDYIDISQKFPLTVLAAVEDIELKATSFYVENADSVNPREVKLHITAQCTKGYYAAPLRVWVREAEGPGPWGTMMLTPFVYLEEGESDSLVYTFQYLQGEPGKKYNVISNYLKFNQQAWFGSCDFTLGKDNAVGEIDNDSLAQPEYFTLQGIRVENPGKGIYIMRRGKTVKKVVIP